MMKHRIRERLFREQVDVICPISQSEVDWWFDRFEVEGRQRSPKDMCSSLSTGLEYFHLFKLLVIDRRRNRTTLRIEGKTADAKVYAAERSVEFSSLALSQDFLEIEPPFRGKGIGTILARNCHEVARELRLARLLVTAVDIGSYVWARAGFLPTAESWQSNNCLGQILSCLDLISDLGWRDRNLIYSRLKPEDPEGLWFVSDLLDVVTSPYPPHAKLPLGKILLIDSKATWRGELLFETDDGELTPHVLRARDYLGL